MDVGQAFIGLSGLLIAIVGFFIARTLNHLDATIERMNQRLEAVEREAALNTGFREGWLRAHGGPHHDQSTDRR